MASLPNAVQLPPPIAEHPVRTAALLLAIAVVLCLFAYLVMSVPAAWFPRATQKTWAAQEMGLARGTGKLENDEFVVSKTDSNGAAVVSINTDFHSAEYPVVFVSGIDFADNADVRLLWWSDYSSAKLNSAQLTIASGRLLPISLANNPGWVGRIKGLAILIRAPLQQPARLGTVTIKPTGAFELLQDRAREWLAFEGWTGTSINAVAGGADVQDLPLPTLLAVGSVIAAGACFWLARRRSFAAVLPALLGAVFVIAWALLDARWVFNLERQVANTAEQYGNKSWREKRLSVGDGALFAFIEKARGLMPDKPVRVFIAADAHYFRGRAAYHLYPHNVYYDPWQNTLPPTQFMHAGDYVLVYYRKGMQYDPSQQMLRYEGSTPIGAEAVLVEPGAALFRIK